MDREFIVNNLIAGVYTHNDKYFKKFTDNWTENYVNVELIYNIKIDKFNQNMERLRHKFLQSNKRYWLFMDDDILFPNNQVIEVAMENMKRNDLALCTVYQTTDYELAHKVNPSNLSFEFITWSAGYFMLVDSKKAGLLPFDLHLPTTLGSMSDIEYCMNIIVNDGLLGIAPTMIYHADEGSSPKVNKPFDLKNADQIELNNNINKFFKDLDPKLMQNNPQIELVFLDNGKIDYNETVGGHYLKHKYPDIYHEVVARHHYNIVHTNKKDNFTFTK